jgi:hypothetical protein
MILLLARLCMQPGAPKEVVASFQPVKVGEASQANLSALGTVKDEHWCI